MCFDAPVSAPKPDAPSPSTPTLSGRTVLVIEDHYDSRELLTGVLRSLRAQVASARGVEEAEREVGYRVPDLIVCDINLPDGTGFDFIRWLRARDRGADVPCLAITALSDRFPESLAHGFDAYMRKPLNLDKFSALVVSLVAR